MKTSLLGGTLYVNVTAWRDINYVNVIACWDITCKRYFLEGNYM